MDNGQVKALALTFHKLTFNYFTAAHFSYVVCEHLRPLRCARFNGAARMIPFNSKLVL